jgi:hypothetical protein
LGEPDSWLALASKYVERANESLHDLIVAWFPASLFELGRDKVDRPGCFCHIHNRKKSDEVVIRKIGQEIYSGMENLVLWARILYL